MVVQCYLWQIVGTRNEPKSARKPICDLDGTRTRPDVSSRDTIHDGCRGSESEGACISFPSILSILLVIAGFISLNQSKKRKGNVNAERARRIKYAEDLFRELNRVTFKGNLPEDTKLIWNKRLLTTAGRAKWHRSRDGSQRTEIELADKILDCDERIRNTLSHEMCHLATWIIDRDPKQGHGKLWKHWAAKVMKHRPEIKISTRHDYDISYPYQWKCANCAKIYGRFSKSIHPAECICGACKQGELIPLFHEKPKKTKAIPTLATSEPKGKSQSRNVMPLIFIPL
ncbi:hypothetical protein AMATHDRAFT_135041 [Amanita thiersii Skay4041]|uniref:SprT-like domain-containing protein n=1 Tax=Amanita thiersii Skay4041 TaxID=703135 RepID=A0A2A9NVW6_9AGAR|nr:hypothetical protein AMATHDRAFT_135041 [Amanita thiersii Skay4041]